MEFEIVSLNVGKPKPMTYQNKEVISGIYKSPVNGRVHLSYVNFEGDAQADLVHHGGRDKAICVYPFEHYAYWENELAQQLPYGAFGENLTTKGLLETAICIGDQFKIGDAVVEVSQPRQPCYKLAARHGWQEMPLKIQETGYTGFYFRVLEEGTVSPQDRMMLLSRNPHAITLSYANQIMHIEKDNLKGIQEILDIPQLSSSWRKTFQKRLYKGVPEDNKERLTGK